MEHNATTDVLYHYCPVESLYHILDSQTLRLTNIRYMNDSKEISWLFEIAKRIVWNRKHTTGRTKEEVALCDMLLGHCDNLYLDETFFPNLFCVCFSKNGDSLGQWRAYADDGHGVAIGFDRSFLESFISRHDTRLADVIYFGESELSVLQNEVTEAFRRLKKSPHPITDDEIAAVARATEDIWDIKTPFCKNAAFNEEDEVRLVYAGNVNEQIGFKTRIGPVQFCHRNGVVAPYIALRLEPRAKPITKVVLGPCNRVEHTRWGIMEFARSKGIPLARDNFEVSSASYGEMRRIEKLHVPPWSPFRDSGFTS